MVPEAWLTARPLGNGSEDNERRFSPRPMTRHNQPEPRTRGFTTSFGISIYDVNFKPALSVRIWLEAHKFEVRESLLLRYAKSGSRRSSVRLVIQALFIPVVSFRQSHK